MNRIPRQKREQAEKLRRETEEFLANGGTIHQVQPEDCKWHRDMMKKKRGERGPQHIPLVITPSRGTRHPWVAGDPLPGT